MVQKSTTILKEERKHEYQTPRIYNNYEEQKSDEMDSDFERGSFEEDK